jgi:hypothetical protein
MPAAFQQFTETIASAVPNKGLVPGMPFKDLPQKKRRHLYAPQIDHLSGDKIALWPDKKIDGVRYILEPAQARDRLPLQ